MSGYPEFTAGQRVHARRYAQTGLRHDAPGRELTGEWTGTADGKRGMRIDGSGEYLDFGYVFLGGDPQDGTCMYLVTEAKVT